MLALLVAGCGAELDDGRGGGYGPQAVAAPDVHLADGALSGDGALPGDTGPDAGPTRDDFTGTWAHRYDQVGVAELPALGPEPTTTVALSRVEITAGEAPDALVLRSQICAVTIERERDIVQTIIPPAFIAALPETVRPASVEGDRMVAPWFTELRGVVLDDPERDALPTMPDDPRVRDLDGDGQPGLTVRSAGIVDGEIYLVQRTRSRLDGRLAGDTLDGSIDWTVEDAVLGADNPILAMAVPLEPDPDASSIRTTRIDGALDCDAIVADQAAIFAR